jgi:SHS2 domain-containing protein
LLNGWLRFIDHTADVAAELTGATLDELFASAARR